MPYRKIASLCLLSGLAGIAAVQAGAQTYTAPAVITSSQALIASNGNATLAIAVDAASNLFFTRPGDGNLVEDPAGGGAQITLIGGGTLSYPKGVAVDNAALSTRWTTTATSGR